MPAWRALAKQAGARRKRVGRPSAVDPAASAVGTSEGKPPRAALIFGPITRPRYPAAPLPRLATLSIAINSPSRPSIALSGTMLGPSEGARSGS